MDRLYRITLVVIVAAAVGVGAFFAGRETAPSTTSGTTTTSPPVTTAPTTTSTTSAPPTTVAGLCQVSQLRVAQSGGGAAMGTNERTFSLTNTSSAPCTLYGYPGLLLLGPHAAAEPTDVVRGGGLSFENVGPSLVRLAPAAVAYFNVGYSDVMPPCSVATTVEVTPPTNTTHAEVGVSPEIMACDSGTLHVSAVFAATNTAATQTTAPS
jgi:hypothetical protein